MKLVGAGLPKPRSDDSTYLRYRESGKDALTRRFDVIRGKISDRLRDLIEAKKKLEQPAQFLDSEDAFGFHLLGPQETGRG
jgi:hypothetical protein